MTPETVKAFLMIALFLAIEITLYMPQLQARWRRIPRAR